MIAGQATDRITLGAEVTGEAALWAPRCDGPLLVVTAADARPLYRFLVEEARRLRAWGVRLTMVQRRSSPGSRRISRSRSSAQR